MFKNDTDPLRLATTPLDILTLPIVCLMFSLVCSLSYPPSLFLLFTTSGRPFLVWFELYLHIIWFDHTGRFIELFGADDSRPLPRLHAIYNPFDAVHVGNRRPYTLFRCFGFSLGAAFVAVATYGLPPQPRPNHP